MKNVQIVDGADNCAYSIFSVRESEFKLLFPGDGQDIEFMEDFVARVGEERADLVAVAMWKRPVRKDEVNGIHGTLFLALSWKEYYYPNKRESDLFDAMIQARARPVRRRMKEK